MKRNEDRSFTELRYYDSGGRGDVFGKHLTRAEAEAAVRAILEDMSKDEAVVEEYWRMAS